jgi:carboxymethylenebutenolidase
VIEHNIDIATGDGAMNTFVVHPEEGGPHPVVLFLMDAPGKREELHDMARRVATVGYYVMLPNLYYRTVREFDFTLDPTNVELRARMFELMASLTDDLVVDDIRSMLTHADADAAARTGKVGCMGYCMSGPFVFAAAALLPDRVACAASMHGVRLFGDGSPAHLGDKVRGELYFACAEHDEYAPPEMVNGLADHLAAIGANARVEWYPGTHHGFTFPQRPTAYDKPSAERVWERLFALFDRNLR